MAGLLDLQKTKKKVEKFQPDFETEDMVKLAPKKGEKLSRKERLQRQREREDKLKAALAENTETSADDMVKLASEGAVEAREVSQKDIRRLQRLRDRAKEQTGVVEEGAFE